MKSKHMKKQTLIPNWGSFVCLAYIHILFDIHMIYVQSITSRVYPDLSKRNFILTPQLKYENKNWNIFLEPKIQIKFDGFVSRRTLNFHNRTSLFLPQTRNILLTVLFIRVFKRYEIITFFFISRILRVLCWVLFIFSNSWIFMY